MKTPKNVNISTLSSGKFWYHGIRISLEKVLGNCKRDLMIHLDFNFDGLPLFESSVLQFWPILCSIRGKKILIFKQKTFYQQCIFIFLEISKIPPIIIEIWCGNGKLPLKEYLTPLVLELKGLLTTGIVVCDHFIKIHLGYCVCDTPARSYLKSTYISI